MHWKIRRDPFLSRVAERRGEDAVWASGFFLDEDIEDAPLDDVDWLSTPVPRREAAAGRPAALLSTGAFCPVHDGHVAMMERARAAATAAGFDVRAGYLSPGHDAYIRLKCGAAAIPAPARLEGCAHAAAATDWLLVDPWEATSRRVAVNFTDVAARLRAYLRAHVDPAMEVLYVCGGDNARFALAFVEDGGCVVVGRPGSDAEHAKWRRTLAGEPRILWTDGDHPAASRALRDATWIDPRKRRLVVRLEDARAVRTLRIAGTVFAGFQGALVRRLGAVETAAIAAPRDDDDDVLSLDAMLPARQNLAVSRLYALGGAQLLGHVARPGSPPLAAQLDAIPPGTYALREDDRMTGGTLAAVRRLLPDRIAIARTELALDRGPDDDVADSRDFLLGADDGGLVVALPRGAIGRLPYLLPYVDPSVRASVPAADARAFSIDVWALNEATFRGTGLRVRDLPPYVRLPFAEGTTLEEVCRWHRERLARYS